MTARVTQLQQSNTFVADLQRIYAGLADRQREIATGQRISSPSDDPFGSAQVLDFDGQLSDVAQYLRNVEDAISYTDTADSSLQGVLQNLSRVRELLVQANNSPSAPTQTELNAIAAEISQIKESIRDKANTRFGDTYLFAGTATTTQPYPPPGNAYSGNAGAINRRVSPGLTLQINIDGPTVFGTTTGAAYNQLDMFDLLDQVVTDLQSGIRPQAMAAIDLHHSNVTQQLANLGAVGQRLEVTRDRMTDLEMRISEARSDVADVDVAKAYMEYQTQNTMYQSALAAGARIMQTSLLDFI